MYDQIYTTTHHGGITISAGVRIGNWCEISESARIGPGSLVRSFTIICDGAETGANCWIGPSVLIHPNVVIGNNCRIHSHSFLCEGVTLEDEVFIGHGVMFCNEKYPKAVRKVPWKLKDSDRVLVKKGAVIGSNATIRPGVTIGEGAVVGAGAIVADDVPDSGVVISPKAVLIEHRYGDWGKFLDATEE